MGSGHVTTILVRCLAFPAFVGVWGVEGSGLAEGSRPLELPLDGGEVLRNGVTRKQYPSSLIPFNHKPKTQKLKLNLKPHNHPTGDPTPQGRGGHPISGPLTFGGGRGGHGARDHI